MKEQRLTIIEQHPAHIAQPNQTIREAITVWLQKELHK